MMNQNTGIAPAASLNVFVSHALQDAGLAREIQRRLEQEAITSYVYEHDPQYGKSVAEKVQTAILQSDVVVVLLTRDSQRSSYVQQELGFAEAKQKLIVPVLQEGMKDECLAMLRGREYIPLDLEAPSRAIAKLVRYLGRLAIGRAADNPSRPTPRRRGFRWSLFAGPTIAAAVIMVGLLVARHELPRSSPPVGQPVTDTSSLGASAPAETHSGKNALKLTGLSFRADPLIGTRTLQGHSFAAGGIRRLYFRATLENALYDREDQAVTLFYGLTWSRKYFDRDSLLFFPSAQVVVLKSEKRLAFERTIFLSPTSETRGVYRLFLAVNGVNAAVDTFVMR